MLVMSSPAHSSTPSRRERQRAKTRERLFEAAVAEFRKVGFAEAQIPAIAQAAGVVRGTFYFHFPSKEHVLLELVERRQEEFAERLAELRGTDAGLPEVLEALLDLIEPPVGEESSPELVREIVAMQLRNPIDPDAEDPVSRELTPLLVELAERGEIRTDVPLEPLGVFVTTSVFGLAVARGASLRDERLPTREQVLAMLLPGLRP